LKHENAYITWTITYNNTYNTIQYNTNTILNTIQIVEYIENCRNFQSSHGIVLLTGPSTLWPYNTIHHTTQTIHHQIHTISKWNRGGTQSNKMNTNNTTDANHIQNETVGLMERTSTTIATHFFFLFLFVYKNGFSRVQTMNHQSTRKNINNTIHIQI
jgi:hypothetical protein